nr:hypothetical protein BAR15_130065 [Bartonella sp. AR 15-3]
MVNLLYKIVISFVDISMLHHNFTLKNNYLDIDIKIGFFVFKTQVIILHKHLNKCLCFL